MGYTHYWYRTRSFTLTEWKSITDDCHKIIKHCIELDVDLRYEFDNKRKPSVTKNYIRFNGAGEKGHETFLITRSNKYQSYEDKNKPSFNFCNTGGKPYDLAVCLILLRISHYVPSPDFLITSDGHWIEDWKYARKVYSHLFSESTTNPFK